MAPEQDYVPPDSVSRMRKLIELRASAIRQRSRMEEEFARDAGARLEAPAGLGRMWLWLEKLRLYASPRDLADWDALIRASAHRAWMHGGVAPRVRRHFKAAGARWKFIGPRAFMAGQAAVSGRVNSLAIDQGNPSILYAGAAGGGVWKSTNRGVSWTPLSDSWPFQEVSSLALDPTDGRVVYAGTGDFHSWSTRSFGLMKSIDGGASWVNLAIPETSEFSISSVVVHPDSPNIVLMCGGRGRGAAGRLGFIWRSTDHGMTWTQVVAEAAEWSQIAIGGRRRNRTRAIYAVGWNRANGGRLFRSIDRGATWVDVAVPWGAGQFSTAVATSPLASDRVYVLAGADRRVFRSADIGNNWNDVTDNLRQDDFEWDQAWYDWCLACGSSGGINPHDVLLLGLKHLQRWEAQSRSWAMVDHGHDDMHVVLFDAANPQEAYLGNDGGVYRLAQDTAGNWKAESLNQTLGVTECYRGDASATDHEIVLAGTQDNAVASSQADLSNWSILYPPAGGDAIDALVNPQNDSIQFSQGGVAFWGIARTADGWSSQVDISPQTITDIRDPFSMPITMNAAGTRLYWGTDFLWLRDEATGTWQSRVGGTRLAGGADESVRALAVAPGDEYRVYTGSTDGQVWSGTGPSWTWTRIDQGTPALPGAIVTAIAVHPNDPNDIVVTIGGTGTGHVWHCADTAANPLVWRDVSGNGADALPDVPAVAIVRDPRAPGSLLYAGTDIGVFCTTDGGATWIDLTIPHGLPAAQLWDLQLRGRYLYAFTHGRGIWRLEAIPFLGSSPTGACIGSELFVVGSCGDGQIVVCQAHFGQAFSEWRAVNGHGGTDTAPAVTAIRSSLFIFVKGLDQRIYLNQAPVTPATSVPREFARAFSGWFEVQGQGQTDVAPAAATVQDTVFVFIRHLDGRILVNQADFGHAFGSWFEVQGNGRTDAAPAAAALRNTVFVFIKGLDQRLYVNQAELGHPFSGWFELQGGGLTDVAPAATAIGDSVFVFIKGINGRIYVNQAQFGHGFSGWFEVQGNGLTDCAPGAASVANSVFTFVKGLDAAPWVNQAEYRHAFSGWHRMSDEGP